MSDSLLDQQTSTDRLIRFGFSACGNQVAFSQQTEKTLRYYSVYRSDRDIDSCILLASEASLKEIWDTPEEDEAWKDL